MGEEAETEVHCCRNVRVSVGFESLNRVVMTHQGDSCVIVLNELML